MCCFSNNCAFLREYVLSVTMVVSIECVCVCVCVCISQVSSLCAGYVPLSGLWPAGRPPTRAPWLEFLKTIICSVCARVRACECMCMRLCVCVCVCRHQSRATQTQNLSDRRARTHTHTHTHILALCCVHIEVLPPTLSMNLI